jgi:hypothetical protein
MPHNLLFVSTSNLFTNPRLVKEIELALDNGYSVTALVCSFHNWSYHLNEEIKKKLKGKVNLIEARADRSSLLYWFKSTLFQKFQILKLKLGFSDALVLSDVLNKRSILLRWELKKLKKEYQLVIAHNPGAFVPAALFAMKCGIPFGVDVEDYHPGETNITKQSQLMKQLIQQVLPKAAYVSAAAPLILEAVQKDCASQLQNALTILNYFNKEEFVPPVVKKNELMQFVWFSQNIDFGRGLEQLLSIFKSFNFQIQLHLYGNVNPSFYDSQQLSNCDIIIHPPVSQEQLHRLLSRYDVGVALEDANSNFNRKICLTNKILAYYQAGLYILATDTLSQVQFISNQPMHGHITSLENLQESIKKIIQHKNDIKSNANKRFNDASKHHSEVELKKLTICWRKLI